MKSYVVTIEEKLVYRIEVDAETEEKAEEEAFRSWKFESSEADDNDSEVVSIEEMHY